jgi:hypothetical protein
VEEAERRTVRGIKENPISYSSLWTSPLSFLYSSHGPSFGLFHASPCSQGESALEIDDTVDDMKLGPAALENKEKRGRGRTKDPSIIGLAHITAHSLSNFLLFSLDFSFVFPLFLSSLHWKLMTLWTI